MAATGSNYRSSEWKKKVVGAAPVFGVVSSRSGHWLPWKKTPAAARKTSVAATTFSVSSCSELELGALPT